MQDLNDKVKGSSLTAAEWNEIPSEIQQAITDSGQTLSSGDLTQLSKAIGGYSKTDKTAAALITPVSGKTMFVESSDGGLFKAVTGAAAATYSDNGGSYCGTQFIPTGGDGSAAWVRVFDGDIYGKWFGVIGDDDGTGSGTDNKAAFDLAISANSGGWVVIERDKKYRIASQLSDSNIIRIKSDAPPIFENSGDVTNNDSDWFPTIVLDGTSLVGAGDPTTSTTGFAINLKGLDNIRFSGVNSAPYVAHFRPTQGYYRNLLIEDFDYHGIWTRGGSLARFKNIYFVRCGRTDPVVNSWCHVAANSSISSINYRRGCAWLAEDRSNATQAGSDDAGRVGASNYRPTTFFIENIWSDINAGTTTLNTSPRDFIFFSVSKMVVYGMFGGYNGTWLGYANGVFQQIYQETYASGGEVVGDGTAFSLVQLNCAFSVSQIQATENIRNLHDKGFTSSQDFYGYDLRENANHYKSRLQLFELILGGWNPDGNSTDWGTYAAKGSVENPSLYFDSTTNCMLGSLGNNHLPWLGFPIQDSGSISNGAGGTEDLDYTILLPNPPTGQASYDIEIQAGTGSNIFYTSWWKVSKTSTKQKYVKVAEIDEASTNIAIAATGTGTTETLRITNNTGGTVTWTAKSKVINNNDFSRTN